MEQHTTPAACRLTYQFEITFLINPFDDVKDFGIPAGTENDFFLALK